MKKTGILLAVIIALNLISSVSAVEIEFEKEPYFLGETLQAEISGSFIDSLKAENIGLYKNNSVHKTPIAESGILKSGTIYFYYAVLPDASESQGEYSLRIENTRYYENNIQLDKPKEKNFSITQSNTSYLSFAPGYIYATSDFEITIKAYNADQQIDVDFSEAGQKESFMLGQASSKKVYFSISNISEFTKSSIKINSYNVPVLISPQDKGNNIPKESEEDNLGELLDISPNSINETLLSGSDSYFRIIIANNGMYSLRNLSIKTSGKELNVSALSIEYLIDDFELILAINAKKNFNGWINISMDSQSVIIPVSVKVTSDASGINYNIEPINKKETCAEMGKPVCASGEKCSGTTTNDKFGSVCCNGFCEEQKKSSGWIWGLLIIVLLGAAIWFIYRKSKKTAGGSSSLLRKRTEDFKERMNPQPNFEIKKSLAKS